MSVALAGLEAVMEAARESGHPGASTELIGTVRRLGEALSAEPAYQNAAAHVPTFLYRSFRRSLADGDEEAANTGIQHLGQLGVWAVQRRNQALFDLICHWLRGVGRSLAEASDHRIYNEVDINEFEARPLDTLVAQIRQMADAVNRVLLDDNIEDDPFLPPDLVWVGIDICRALTAADAQAARFRYPMGESLGVTRPVSEAAARTGNGHLLNQGLSGILECLALLGPEARPPEMNRIAADTFVACGFWTAANEQGVNADLGAATTLELVIKKLNDSDLSDSDIVDALDGMLGRGEWMRVPDKAQKRFVIDLEKGRGGKDLHSSLTRWSTVALADLEPG